jgi:hypothetical protein
MLSMEKLIRVWRKIKILPHPREKGPMGGAPYMGSEQGVGGADILGISVAITRERAPR